MNANEILKDNASLIEQRLDLLTSNLDTPSEIAQSVRYSLLAGGKRIRPSLLLEFYSLLGGNKADALNFACAVEMIHTYSLIHDDLPCMDDDDLRRGRPSNHKKFGEATALLAGDALLTLAFEVASNYNENLDSSRVLKAINHLAKAAGITGMIGGQVIDLQSEGKEIDLKTLEILQSKKTVALLKVNAQIACALANATNTQTNALESYCDYIGKAFQVVDDILDVLGDEKLLGKPIGSDKNSNKNTYINFLGLEKSKELANDLTNKAKAEVAIFGERSETFSQIADILCNRNA